MGTVATTGVTLAHKVAPNGAVDADVQTALPAAFGVCVCCVDLLHP